jgi:hypothetical protein
MAKNKITMCYALCYAGAALAGILALGSKEISVTLPFFIFLYEWYFFQDLSWNWFKRYFFSFAGILLFVFLGILYIIVKLNPDGSNLFAIILSGYRFNDPVVILKLLTEIRVVVYYISLLALPLPSRLNIDYDFNFSNSLISPATTLFSAVGVIGLIVLSLYTAKRERLISFSILWFLGNLIIESAMIGLDIVFEHRTYLPSMMISLMAVVLIWRSAGKRWLKVFVLSAVTVIFAMWAYERNSVWCTEVTLWQDCVNKSPNKARPHYNLGLLCQRRAN